MSSIRLHSGFAVTLLLVMSQFIPGLHAQEKANPSPSANSEYASEPHVVEKSEVIWKFQADGTNTHEISASICVQSSVAVQQFGILTFQYEKFYETMEVDYVRVRKPDGSVVPTPPEDIQDTPARVAQLAPYYTDQREKQVPVKGLAIGDTVEFKCSWQQTKTLVPGQFWLSFQFSRDEIILEQKVEITVPREKTVKVKSPEFLPKVSEEGGWRIYTWNRANLFKKPLPKVDFAQLAMRGRLPGPDIQLTTFQSWEELGHWYYELQKERTTPTAEIREKAADLTHNVTDSEAKSKAIYNYVSENYRYIGIAFGAGRYQPHFAGEVLADQYGDCKDKHTLFAALLAAVGIQAYPALISSSRDLDQDVPYPGQFDHLITVIPQGNQMIWLDTTPAVAPFGYIQTRLRDKDAFVLIFGSESKFARTPLDPPFASFWKFKMDAKLDELGTLEGKVEQELRGDMEFFLRTALHNAPKSQWKDVIQQFSQGIGFAGEVSGVSASPPESTETPLTVSYAYERKNYPDWKNHRVVFPSPVIFAKPPEEQGKFPSTFWFGSPREFHLTSRLEFPSGYTPDIPKTFDLRRDFAEYHSRYILSGNALIGQFDGVRKQREVSGHAVKEYDAFAEAVLEDRNQFITVQSGTPNPPLSTPSAGRGLTERQ